MMVNTHDVDMIIVIYNFYRAQKCLTNVIIKKYPLKNIE